ncbi:serine/threonine protein kinase [Candidatus Woesearchaeota archaeon]|nr:serine/threonine protein kinase [Candidatus Woesearchaeota archaeon]
MTKGKKSDETIIGNYKVLEKISEGGFAVTYKAEHSSLGTLACIKHNINISPEDSEILKQEAKAIWDLRHFALPAMRDIVELPDKSLALVMSYIPGPTLDDLVKKNDGLPPEHVAWISCRVLDALRYLHYFGVIHGDVKPQNIIVQPKTHTAVLVDYGLSMVKPGRSNSAAGYTPMFASPEHMSGLPLIPETDLYCLGLTMIYALGGDPKAMKIPANTPEPLTDFIRKLTVRDVNSRYSWHKCDVLEELIKAREKSFGRKRSDLLQIKE